MAEVESVVTITLPDMYKEIVGMRGDVQRMTIKLDGVLDVSRDHETRIRTLEASGANHVTEDQLKTELDKRSEHKATWLNTALAAVAAIAAVVAIVH